LRAKLARAQALCKEAATECQECIQMACDATGILSNQAANFALETAFGSLVTAASAFFAIVQVVTGVAPDDPSSSQKKNTHVCLTSSPWNIIELRSTTWKQLFLLLFARFCPRHFSNLSILKCWNMVDKLHHCRLRCHLLRWTQRSRRLISSW
jgi:hypothetical protein